MFDYLTLLILAIVGVLRRLWRKLTGGEPVPVPVRVRRFALPDSSRSPLNGLQFPVDATSWPMSHFHSR